MRNLGVHAGLALAGIIAGLPAAAVMQWNREPPRIIWSRIAFVVRYGAREESTDPWSPRQRLATAPHGLRVTSIRPGIGMGGRSAIVVTTVSPRPTALYLVGRRVLRASPREHVLTLGPPHAVTVDGVTWHRIALSDSP